MISKNDAYRGCLLGLAIGDAMGYPVDTKTWNQIREDYGPYGLMGFDLCNGYADVTSHTQLAAFSCNGLLIGQTREVIFLCFLVAQQPVGAYFEKVCQL